MTSVKAPIAITTRNNTFNYGDYLRSASPPAFSFTSILSLNDLAIFELPYLKQKEEKQVEETSKKEQEIEKINKVAESFEKKNKTKKNKNNKHKNTFKRSHGAYVKFKRVCRKNELDMATFCNKTSTEIVFPAIINATFPPSPLERTFSCPSRASLKLNETKETCVKKVSFADDLGKELVQIKIFTDPVCSNRSRSFPKNSLESQNQLKRSKTEREVLKFTPELIKELQEIERTKFGFSPMFSQPIYCGKLMLERLNNKIVSLEKAEITKILVQNGDELGEEMQLVTRVAVKKLFSSASTNVFLRITCDKWHSWKDVQAELQPYKKISDDLDYHVYKLSKTLTELHTESSTCYSDKDQVYPTSLEFAICYKDFCQEKWDNNNTQNYKFVRFTFD